MKRRHKILTVVLLVLLYIVPSVVGFFIGYAYRDNKIITIRQMQKKIGCKKIDGKLGNNYRTGETQRMWKKKWQEQNPGRLMY